MDEKNLISASEGSIIQAAGVNNLCNVLQGGPINGNSQTNSVSANNYYIGSGETPGVGKPYKDGDEITLKAQSGEEFSATVDLSEPGGSINVDDYERYNEANYDPDNIETKTALCAVPNVAAQTGYDFLEGTCDVEGWLASHYWKDEEAAQYWKDTKEGFTKEAKEANEFYKSFAPNKELFDVKTKDGMLMVDIAMMASLAKDGVVLGVKVAGKMPKSIKELKAILMRCFGKGVSKAELDLINQYPNNNVFSKSVSFNAGEDGTGITYKVFQRNDIDWDMVRTTGAKKGRNLTNAKAAEQYGLAPILDADGSVATLHHSQQHSVGPLFEASTRYHNISNAKKAPLHPYKGKLNPFNPMSEETRSAFQKVDSIEYWKTRGRDAGKGVK